ncbi:EAL domain-containing protein [Citrobacter meridianamericanus]|uniref:EAL domain-containing protein n=1 Tax=Citrobacter meridianamericanus TaxID=2894201 RepID=A0ABT1BFK1_9ENTR|nr:EAL domain-containing protein [Citrobacter meridianamericanus]MCO5784644.1 EAL domain-containing protein [Citrobacter meridianamericanus]
MNHFLYLNNEIFKAIHLPEAVTVPGETHLAVFSFYGMKAEPLVDLHTGLVTGHEFLSMLPVGVCSETFFRYQSGTSLAELFLLQLMLSEGLTAGLRFFNLPVRVLLNSPMCDVLSAQPLTDVVVEIQDPEILPTFTPLQCDHLRKNLDGFRRAGARIYVDDVTPSLMQSLAGMSLQLSGLKVSRQEFQPLCTSPRALSTLNVSPHVHSPDEFRFVAEGIETPEQRLLAILAGYTHGQGWLWPAKIWQFAGATA